ncbi:MAG: DegT/DnrJ/EryC1/StrS family aminotransferase [Acidobacteriota bacterium]
MHRGLMKDRIPISGPWITDREVEYAADAARTAWYSGAGEYSRRFEQAVAAYVGTKHAVSLPHCTAGVHLALVALGVGAGDEVIVPDATWIASAAPITYVGATPVFADVDPDTWCLDVGAFEACVTSRTKAVIAVDLYGGMPDMDALLAAAGRLGIVVIEDAAEAIGAEYRGRRAGSLGAVGVFSFHGSKTIVTGEGGALVTDSDELHDRVRVLCDHGRPPHDRFFRNTEVAFKYRMSDLQAAVGLAQIERVEEIVARKREIFSWYASHLASVDGVCLNIEPAGTRNSYWMVTAIIDARFGLDNRTLMAAFAEHGIDTRPFFHPLSSIPAYADHEQAVAARERNAVSHDIPRRGINLPSALNLTGEQVQRVCDVLRQILARSSSRPNAPA